MEGIVETIWLFRRGRIGELAALTRPVVDEELRAEIRSLVEARNARRVARGHEPLDVEAEIAKRLSELDG